MDTRSFYWPRGLFLITVMSALSFDVLLCHSKNNSLGIDKIQEDPCSQAKPYVQWINEFTKTAVYHAGLTTLKDKALNEPVKEHIISFGKDEQGNITFSSISSGGRSSGNVPEVANGFADLHNHPRNTPPSSGDLYGLIEKNKKNSHYNYRLVITSNDRMYALVITDSALARNFTLIYPPQQTPGYSPLFPDNLLDEYREIQYRYGAPEEMAMAYMLEKYKTGVSLLKQDFHGDFIKLRTAAYSNGKDLVFESNNCR